MMMFPGAWKWNASDGFFEKVQDHGSSFELIRGEIGPKGEAAVDSGKKEHPKNAGTWSTGRGWMIFGWMDG